MKRYKPTTPSRRGASRVDFSGLTKKKPERNLVVAIKKRGGRSHSGKITVRHRGGGARKIYRIIDFKQQKLNIPAEVMGLEYDPNRSAFIALLRYKDGQKRYILAAQGIEKGSRIITSEKVPIVPGNRMKLKNILPGTTVHNIELRPGQGGKLVRSAGTGAKILTHEGKHTHLEMPSREVRKILKECFASVGAVSNSDHRYVNLGKAGRARHKGKRPTVRGTAMNPVDHPHGGGEGRAPIGLKHPKTPWGKPALGVKTRKKHKSSNKLIIKRR